MRFVYQEWDGLEFSTQDRLFASSQLLDFVLEYGDEAIRALRDLEDNEEGRKLIQRWIDDGLLDKMEAKFHLTPRAVNFMQRRALMEIFRDLKSGSPEGHESRQVGVGGERLDATKRYQWGESLQDVDLAATMRNVVRRTGPRLPLGLQEEDLELHANESKATCSTVILLDMSGSMARWNRFVQAKRCAMALYALIHQRFALDTVDVVGFASEAEFIPEQKLPLVRPKPVTMHDPEIDIRVPIGELASAPQHFTNLHLGLLTARQILGRRGGANKQLFIITDGEPTAHVEGGYVHLIYPPDDSTMLATLGEAARLARTGIRFSTFALIDDYFSMDWVDFVGQLTRLTKGVAFYCTSGDITHAVMESYLTGRKRKSAL